MKVDYFYEITKIVSTVFYVILGFILIICLYSFISLNVLSQKYVNFFSYTVFQVGSNSMAPTITTNDLILVKITDDVSKQDIITYEEDDVLITHRLLSKNGDTLITKGDANNTEDKVVSPNQVIGKVVKIMPNLGTWYKVITTPKIIFLICLTLFLFSLAFSYTGKRHLTKKDDFGIYFSGIKMKDENKNDW